MTASDIAAYLELIHEFPPRPIRNEDELDRAIARVDVVIDRPHRSQAERDYLFLLGLLIEDYEKEAYPPEPLSDADLLRDLLEEKGITQTQFAAEAGIADSTISAILAGKRKISKGHIASLVRIFGVDPSIFFRD